MGINDDEFITDEFGSTEAKAYSWLRSGFEEALEYIKRYLFDRERAENGGPALDVSRYLPRIDEDLDRAKVTYHDNLLKETRKAIYDPARPPDELGESDDLALPPAKVREVLLQAGGGPVSPADMPTSGGIATGRTIQDVLADYEVPTDGYLWLYGATRKRPFNSHLQLDGAHFHTPTDAVLAIWPEDAWLRKSHYAPQDHWGCLCVVGFPEPGDICRAPARLRARRPSECGNERRPTGGGN